MEEVAVECTHCHVEMTSRSAGGGTMRYYSCPRCKRTYSSFYDEVFKMGAGARLKARASGARAPEPARAAGTGTTTAAAAATGTTTRSCQRQDSFT